jgi:hypothetical protein
MDSSNEDEVAMIMFCRWSRANWNSIDVPVKSCLIHLESFSPNDQVSRQVTLADLDFTEATDRRDQIAAAYKILHALDVRREFTLASVDKFV